MPYCLLNSSAHREGYCSATPNANSMRIEILNTLSIPAPIPPTATHSPSPQTICHLTPIHMASHVLSDSRFQSASLNVTSDNSPTPAEHPSLHSQSPAESDKKTTKSPSPIYPRRHHQMILLSLPLPRSPLVRRCLKTKTMLHPSFECAASVIVLHGVRSLLTLFVLQSRKLHHHKCRYLF